MAHIEEKNIDTSGICVNCGIRKSCDFIKGIESYIRDQNCADQVMDIDITVYSCKNYESEIFKSCEKNVCIYCKKEE